MKNSSCGSGTVIYSKIDFHTNDVQFDWLNSYSCYNVRFLTLRYISICKIVK